MAREFWINLPVKDVQASRTFFSKIGFAFRDERCNETMACMVMGNNDVVVMLFAEGMFKNFSQNAIADTTRGTEVLLSVDAENREDVDDIINKVIAAGGSVYGPPREVDGWMYGASFSDPDGHRWNVLYMDHAKMPG